MQSASALIDFLIPQFQDKRIIRAISSIIDHPESDGFRIIVLDGGHDELLQKDVREALRDQDVHRVAPDRGIYDALNAGLAMATADWIGWIGSDDLLAATFSAKPLKNAGPKIDFLSYVTLFFRDSDGMVTRIYRPTGSRLLRRYGFHLPHFSTFIRTDTAKSLVFDITQANYADQLYMYDLESGHIGDVSNVVSTLMCEGGLSNSSRSTIVRTNIDVAKTILKRKNRVGVCVYIFAKLVYKLYQRVLATISRSNIRAYRSMTSIA